jgi:hypothetical protein
MALLVATPCWALDKLSLQLKWLHQFQFAGYYTGLEQGFYRDAGPAAIVNNVDLIDVGEHRLRDLSQPQRIYQVRAEALRGEFPPTKMTWPR